MAAEATLRWRDGGEGYGRAFALAVGLHLLLAALFWLFTILDFDREAPSAAGEPITADLDVSAADARAARQALAYTPPEPVPEPEPVEEETVPPPQPLPEPVPDEAVVERQVTPQERIPVPDEQAQEEVSADAISEETREREQEARRRQEQIDLTEDIKRQEQAEQRERLARQQKLEEIRAERARLQRQAQLSEQRLKQLADRQAQSASLSAAEAAAQSDAAASGSPPAGNRGTADSGLLEKYRAAIQSAVTGNWTRPENMPNLPCKMTIIQLPGGQVMDVQFDGSCPYDDLGKRSVEAAVLKAQPLPYAGFESVFDRRLNFTFRPSN